MQFAFRMKTNAAILDAGGAIRTGMSRIRPSKGLDDFIPSGSLRTGAADTYPATPETPASRGKRKIAISFQPSAFRQKYRMRAMVRLILCRTK
jgi:hypothetical protein